jgi:hypothetical protein
MKLGIMQAYTFPYLGYFQLIKAVDKYILYDRLSFIKEAWMNRNRILNSGSGSPQQILIPLDGKSSNSMIYEVKIFNKFDWRKKLLNSIYLNYKKAPQFEQVYALLVGLINYETESIADFNNNSITGISKYLGINTPISTDEAYFDEIENQLAVRNKFYSDYDPETYPVKVLRVFEICKNEGADVFYNAIGGKELYDKDLFRQHGIQAGFINSDLRPYDQNQATFTPGLSIIDVMMFNSVAECGGLLDSYTVI